MACVCIRHNTHSDWPIKGILHSRSQSPWSMWPVAGIESTGLVQHRKSVIHGLPIKSSKSDWLRIQDEYSVHTRKIGSSQSSRSLPQVRRIVGSGTRMGIMLTCPLRWLITVSSTFHEVDFDGSLLPLFITSCYNHGIKILLNHRWTRWYHFRDTIGYHSNTMTR